MLSQVAVPQAAVGAILLLALYFVYSVAQRPEYLARAFSYTPLSGGSHLAYILKVYFSEPFRTRCLQNAHKEHSIVNVTPKHLSFKSPAAIQDIYGHSSPCGKGDLYILPKGGPYNILNTPDRLEHRVKRKRLAAAFATKNLLAWENKVVDKVQRLILQMDHRLQDNERFQKGAGDKYFDFRTWLNLFTIEAIADIAFSQRLGVLESGKDIVPTRSSTGEIGSTNFIDAVHGGARAAFPWVLADVSTYPVLRQIYWYTSKWMRQQCAATESFGDFIRWIVHERVQRHNSNEDEKLDDFMTQLLQENTNGKIEDGELHAEANIIMDAGSDTTAIALTHVLWQLIRHPTAMSRLREELAPYFESTKEDEIPSFTSLSHCTYLKACLDESLRLHPPLSAGLQRKPPPEGAMIDGVFVPGTVNVSVPAYVAHRNPDIFPDPESFVPERWLSRGDKESDRQNKHYTSFIPFSLGSRGCIGRNISYIEQTLLVATLVHRFEFSLPDSWEMEWEERSNLWPKDFPVVFKRR